MPDSPQGTPIRKRLKRREVEGGLRFLTFSCQRRLPMFSSPSAADLFADRLAWARRRYQFKLFAWVVMPEHVHLMVRPAPGGTMTQALHALKTSVARHALAGWKDVAALNGHDRSHHPCAVEGRPRFWQRGGGFDRNVRNVGEFRREVRYTHRNPVERGLVERPEQWRWSSVRWWMGRRDGELECDPPPDVGIDWSLWKGFL
jgi:putative transposase